MVWAGAPDVPTPRFLDGSRDRDVLDHVIAEPVVRTSGQAGLPNGAVIERLDWDDGQGEDELAPDHHAVVAVQPERHLPVGRLDGDVAGRRLPRAGYGIASWDLRVGGSVGDDGSAWG